jgi:hypothetical protein
LHWAAAGAVAAADAIGDPPTPPRIDMTTANPATSARAIQRRNHPRPALVASAFSFAWHDAVPKRNPLCRARVFMRGSERWNRDCGTEGTMASFEIP